MSSGESSMANNENSSAASLYDFSALRLSTTLHDDDNHLGDKSSKIISSPLKTAAAAAAVSLEKASLSTSVLLSDDAMEKNLPMHDRKNKDR
ncbi:MAG: hypothetical protein MHMPM18_003078 [Marteilia pararefringens]